MAPNAKWTLPAARSQTTRTLYTVTGSGVVIGEQLDKYMPLISSKGVRQTPWSEGQNVRQLEPLGFIKFDILGLSTLRMIEGCIERILKKQGVKNPTFKHIKQF